MNITSLALSMLRQDLYTLTKEGLKPGLYSLESLRELGDKERKATGYRPVAGRSKPISRAMLGLEELM